jgi:sugar O-acyltransferase (sialic acid O-acetyltransferase NeuD family)
MNKKPLIIFGAGGLGREVKAMVSGFPDWHVAGFCDDNLKEGTIVDDVPVLGGCSYLQGMTDVNVIVAIGAPKAKVQIVESLKATLRIHYPVIIHPNVTFGDRNRISIGEGSIIAAGTNLTTSIVVGKHVLINLNVTLGHDSIVGDCCSIMPGANLSGETKVGNGVLIGAGANILNQISIGDYSIVAAGAVVTKNVPSNVMVAGVPAAIKKQYDR